MQSVTQCSHMSTQLPKYIATRACNCCYLQYVERCFNSASLFHKALKEAFEAFCNKPVAGSQMAELMANYCNALLKKVRCRAGLQG